METEQEEQSSSFPLKLFLFGFVLAFVGVLVVIASVLLGGDGTVSFGGVIFVGPIPAIVGAGQDAFLAIIVAAVLTIVGFIVFFWMRKQVPKG